MFGVEIKNRDNLIVDTDLNNLLDKLKIDYSQFYRGIVVDNQDPDKKGRIKVRVPQIYGINVNSDTFISTDSIPWATCGINQAGNDSGTYLPPNIGDTVFVAFEAGQPEYPIYFGGIFTKRDEDDLEDGEMKGISSNDLYNNIIIPVKTDDLPQEVINGTERVIYKSLKGATIYLDDRDGSECIKIIDQSGQSIIMENLSDETLNRRGSSLGKNSKSQIVLTNNAGDSITLSQGKIHLKSENIIFETDNFIQIGSEEFTDEINVADIIIGKETSTKMYTFNILNTDTGDYVPNLDYVISYSGHGAYVDTGKTTSEPLSVELETNRTYTINISGEGYYPTSLDFNTLEDSPNTINVFVSEETTEDVLKIVLTWNSRIPDMDSHTLIYDNNSQVGHVAYNQKYYKIDDTTVVELDLDDTDYYGPETTTINKSFNYRYLFYVDRYSEYNNITDSNCNVKVYNRGVLIENINMPVGTYDSSYKYWNVLTYNANTNQIEVNNQIITYIPSL